MRLSTSTILSVVSDVEPDSLFGSYSHSLAGRKGKGPECNHRAFSRHRGELHASTKHSSIWEYSKHPLYLSSSPAFPQKIEHAARIPSAGKRTAYCPYPCRALNLSYAPSWRSPMCNIKKHAHCYNDLYRNKLPPSFFRNYFLKKRVPFSHSQLSKSHGRKHIACLPQNARHKRPKESHCVPPFSAIKILFLPYHFSRACKDKTMYVIFGVSYLDNQIPARSFVIQVIVTGVRQDLQTYQYQVFLYDPTSTRQMTIWVDPYIADALTATLQG